MIEPIGEAIGLMMRGMPLSATIGPAAQQDEPADASRVPGGEPQGQDVADQCADHVGGVDVKRIEHPAQEIRDRRPVDDARVAHRRAQASAGPVEPQAAKALELAHERAPVRAGTARARDE